MPLVLYNNSDFIKNIYLIKDKIPESVEMETTLKSEYNFNIKMAETNEVIYMYSIKNEIFNENSEIKLQYGKKLVSGITFPKNYRMTFQMKLKSQMELLRNIIHIKNNEIYDDSKYESNILLINLTKENKLEFITGTIDNPKKTSILENISLGVIINVTLIVIDDKMYIYVNNFEKNEYIIKNISINRNNVPNCDIFGCSPFISQANIELKKLKIQSIEKIIGIANPLKIKNLSVFGNQDERVLLRWDLNRQKEDVIKYVIFSDDEDIPIKETSKDNITYSNLINGNKYNFKIYALSKYNLKSEISIFDAVTPGPFNSSKNNIVTTYENNKNVLRWVSVYGVNDKLFNLLSYNIYRQKNFEKILPLVEIIGMDIEIYEDLDVQKGNMYKYWITTKYESMETEYKKFNKIKP